MLIGIVGDVHLSNNIRCRTDDFLTTALNKLAYIAENNDKVIILGDLFHVCTNNDFLFNKVYKVFKKFEGKFVAIPGNHDVFHNNLSRIDSITLGSLSTTKVLDLKTSSFKLGGVTFDVSLVMKDLKKLGDENNEKILLGHNYFEFMTAPDESFTRDEIRKLNYKYVFLGHDHKPYEDEFIGNSTLIRMGSLTRVDTQLYNKDRNLQYCRLDTDTMEVVKFEVPMRPVDECYLPNAFTKTSKEVKHDYAGLSALLKKFDKQYETKLKLSEILKGLKASDAQINYIREVHRDNNVGFN